MSSSYRDESELELVCVPRWNASSFTSPSDRPRVTTVTRSSCPSLPRVKLTATYQVQSGPVCSIQLMPVQRKRVGAPGLGAPGLPLFFEGRFEIATVERGARRILYRRTLSEAARLA